MARNLGQPCAIFVPCAEAVPGAVGLCTPGGRRPGAHRWRTGGGNTVRRPGILERLPHDRCAAPPTHSPAGRAVFTALRRWRADPTRKTGLFPHNYVEEMSAGVKPQVGATTGIQHIYAAIAQARLPALCMLCPPALSVAPQRERDEVAGLTDRTGKARCGRTC